MIFTARRLPLLGLLTLTLVFLLQISVASTGSTGSTGADGVQKRKSAPPKRVKTTGEWVDPQFGRAASSIPEFTDQGSWDGTWFYSNRDSRMMVWMKTVDGKPQYRVQYFSMASREQFSTDWNGFAEYENDGYPGSYSLKPKEATANKIVADWRWSMKYSNSSKLETGEVIFRRAGDGRRMVWLFDPLTREIDRFGEVSSAESSFVWTLTKISKRHIVWDELF